MTIQELIDKRRGFRSLDPVVITKEAVGRLTGAAQLAPSCFNNQPWRYIFVYEKNALDSLKKALSPGNDWALSASMIVAVCGKKELDCIMKDGREYYQFDTGMATAFLILTATELDLVAHPIAGYDPKIAKEVLAVPEDMTVSVLLIVGRHSKTLNPVLKDHQVEAEKERPQRLDPAKFAFHNKYGKQEIL
jgi:nitroreductase